MARLDRSELTGNELTGKPILPAKLNILMVGANYRPATAKFLGVASPLATGFRIPPTWQIR